MGNLDKYTLSKNKESQKWELKKDGSKKVVEKFETKGSATAGGILPKVIGNAGGSVKIKKLDGTFQEERTFPREKDPKKSRG